jgi:hypothetical protein
VSWPGSDYDYWHNTSDVDGRRGFYSINGVPALKIDGFYPSLGYVDFSLSVATDVDVTITGLYDGGTRTGDFSVMVTAGAAPPAGTYKLFVTLTEDPTVNAYGTFYDTMRQAYPNYNGTSLTFTGPYPQTIQVDGSFGLDNLNESGPYAGQMENYVEANCRLVAWVQDITVQRKVQNSDNVYVTELGDLTDAPANAPALMAMGANYPNPFNPTTAIPVKVAETSSALLQIVGVDGRVIRTLHSGELAAGDYEFSWNGADGEGNSVASGVYMARLITRAGVQSERLVMLK